MAIKPAQENRKVLLIQPPLGRGMARELFQPIFPYGLAHVATALQGAGYYVEVLDIYANQWNRRQVLQRLEGMEYELIGVTAMSTQYSYVKWLTSEIRKRSNAAIVLGGLLATYSPRIVLEHTEVDFCVIGEGEVTAVELAGNLAAPDRVRGIAFLRDGRLITTGDRPYLEDLDSLPYPAYELFPMDVYTRTRFYIHDPSTKIFRRRFTFKTMGVLTGRGCPYTCNFCSKSFSGLRFKSVDRIIDEIKYLKKRFGIEGVHFIDELLIINRKRSNELTEKIAPLNVKWDAQGRVNTVDYDLLKRMKDAGCVAIGFGIESGSDRILARMNKKIRAEQSYRAMEAARRAGLHVKVQLILGYPGETAETVAETVELFRRLKHPGRRFSLILPLPGSPLYRQALEEGRIRDEERYLQEIFGGYGASRYPAFINFTDMSLEEVYRLKAAAEREMEKNYKRELRRNPPEYLKYLHAQAMNGIYKWIRRAVKFYGDPLHYTRRILARNKN